ncbi:MAG: UDP-N-acetylglucosamine--N-acetylmuramyl-(pentapeptide) pyrophosphoryl-undecaprenol N-acetylglucosamine transferase [candidate division WOR-3 bacterium]|nr:UDP-N-acetylglucosamine--N-acetylmuramyl-(pentapeptide) pyrophosphoryl-undecaprenol N-acetylglucosamine transferase [candidate division WOR-3 bacterium]MCX7836724.1 UDP-N-acetylglucosamine--N-acetylmuramyl-(pentapeptide) pyrophosphoryl-undecaprenol N-acetylglucosamine transferase [candidate division WOR-3 bacterium]MDW8113360.1 UDP-N-acetylglucosamine--N-acetylmuramyl-(pentapeptide) pyrophosphoryl-undecaprenol N-acetylglucosamine transferase [candidate division WOR-3 bacterium]
MKYNIFISAAVTGGHIMPGISIYEELKKFDFNCIFLGKKGGIEEKIYKDYNVSYYLLPIYHPFSKGLKETMLFFVTFFYNIFKLLYLYLRFKPKALIATGNYFCILPILTMKIFSKPIYLLEQNTVLGRTVKYFSIFAEKVFLGFPIFNGYFLKKSKFVYTGNPLRREIKEESSEKREEKFCLILGGSLGAKKLVEIGIRLAEEFPNEYFLIQGGKKEDKIIIEKKNLKNVEIFNFRSNIQEYLKKAKLVIARAGGMTISEILYLNIPAIFVPYPFAKDNHQRKNAQYVAKRTGSFLCEENWEEMKKIFSLLLSNEELREKIKENMKKFIKKEGATLIAKFIAEKVKK